MTVSQIQPKELIHRRTLILGDVGSGKTYLTATAIRVFLERYVDADATIIDLAPQSVSIGGMRVGGLIKELITIPEHVRYLAPQEVKLPRITGTTKGEVLRLANVNRVAIDPLLDQFVSSPSPILFMNDLSMYLHAGKAERIRNCIDLVDTFVGNAYYGIRLEDDHGSGISKREAKGVMSIRKLMDSVIAL